MLLQSLAAGLALAFSRNSDASESAYPAEMCGPYTEPVYRVELRASQAENSQMMVNVIRRLLGLRILRTGQEAGDKIRRSYRRADQMRLVASASASAPSQTTSRAA